MAENWLWRWLAHWHRKSGLMPGNHSMPLLPDGPVFLHVGCGQASQAETTPGFQGDDWHEIRLDIDPAAKPDLLASMLDMHMLADGTVDAIFSSHNIEHLFSHEVAQALAEFLRVLKPNGFLVLTCPDLQSVCQAVAANRLLEPLYLSEAGPIAPIDILYGHRPQIAQGKTYMAHRTGFTLGSLCADLTHAGFASVIGQQRAERYELWLLASKSCRPDSEMQTLAAQHWPAG